MVLSITGKMKKTSAIQGRTFLTALSLSSIIQLDCVVNKPREKIEVYSNSEAMNILHDYVYDKCYYGCLIADTENYSFECRDICSKSMCMFDYLLEED